MKCLKCGKENKLEFCTECKEIKHNARAIISQNRTKIIKLFATKRMTPEGFEKFILYTNNIIKYGKIYMEYKEVKDNERYKGFMVASDCITCVGCLLSLYGIISLVVIHI